MRRLQSLFGNSIGPCVLVHAERRLADCGEGLELGETPKASRLLKKTLYPTISLIRRTLGKDGPGTFAQCLGASAIVVYFRGCRERTFVVSPPEQTTRQGGQSVPALRIV